MQAGHTGVMPREARTYDSHGLSTTRWPTSNCGLRARLDHVSDDLVPTAPGERLQAAQRAVTVTLESPEHLLCVGAADTGEPGPDHQPVGA